MDDAALLMVTTVLFSYFLELVKCQFEVYVDSTPKKFLYAQLGLKRCESGWTEEEEHIERSYAGMSGPKAWWKMVRVSHIQALFRHMLKKI